MPGANVEPKTACHAPVTLRQLCVCVLVCQTQRMMGDVDVKLDQKTPDSRPGYMGQVSAELDGARLHHWEDLTSTRLAVD